MSLSVPFVHGFFFSFYFSGISNSNPLPCTHDVRVYCFALLRSAWYPLGSGIRLHHVLAYARFTHLFLNSLSHDLYWAPIYHPASFPSTTDDRLTSDSRLWSGRGLPAAWWPTTCLDSIPLTISLFFKVPYCLKIHTPNFQNSVVVPTFVSFFPNPVRRARFWFTFIHFFLFRLPTHYLAAAAVCFPPHELACDVTFNHLRWHFFEHDSRLW